MSMKYYETKIIIALSFNQKVEVDDRKKEEKKRKRKNKSKC